MEQGGRVKKFGSLVFSAVAAVCICAATPGAQAQVSINVQIGQPPVCPYGYYGFAPYNCAPMGYYGPQWFAAGIFVGAGPWFHGPDGFRGWIDRRYDPRYGYHGPFPGRGERPDWDRHRGWEGRFHGNYYATEYHHDNGNHYGEYRDHHDNGNHYGESRDHHDNGNHNGEDRGRARDNGHDHGQDHGHGHN
jgi:hypothetical protein